MPKTFRRDICATRGVWGQRSKSTLNRIMDASWGPSWFIFHSGWISDGPGARNRPSRGRNRLTISEDSHHSHSDNFTLSSVILRLIHIVPITLRLTHTQTQSHSDSLALRITGLGLSYPAPLIPRLSRTQTLAAGSGRKRDTHVGTSASSNWAPGALGGPWDSEKTIHDE